MCKVLKFSIFLISFVQLLFAQSSLHKNFDVLLKKNVRANGDVDYKGFIEDSTRLNEYLGMLSSIAPKTHWNENEIKAYWMNAYNAFTIQLVIRNYPIKSIKEIGGKIPFINSTWDIKFISIGNEILDLNNIEHGKLRKKYEDPRIHMALVCASVSCPVLRNEAYDPKKLDTQLDDQSKRFLADPIRNNVNSKIAQLSMIFKWYKSDFNVVGGVREFVKKYGPSEISKKTKISYIDYNWALNSIK
ncbi:MAG: DUF547 domain-containing protein [Saprospiraceae bacterium]|nr:DUF547 domain-containing protein [Saprospiraceae bacterium]